MKKRLICALALLLVVCTLNLSSCATNKQQAATKEELPQMTLGMTYIPNVQFSPFYVAKEKGFFSKPSTAMFERYPGKPLGVSPIFRHHGSDEGLFNALIAGKEDAVVAFGDEALQAASHGVEVTTVGVVYRHYPAVIVAKESSRIHSWQDLRGKKIGVPGRFGSSWFALQTGLHAAGLQLSDVHISEIGYQLQPYLETDKVDAVVGFINNDVVRMKNSGMHISVLELPADNPLVAAVLVTRRAWAKKYPERVDTLVSATARGIAEVSKNPEEAIEITKEYDHSLDTVQAAKNAKDVLEATIKLMDLPPLQEGDPGALCAPDLSKFVRMAQRLSELPGVMGTKLPPEAYSIQGITDLARPWPSQNAVGS